MPFSPAGTAGATAATTATIVVGTAAPPPPDLFTVCLANKKLHGCTNATTADEWSGWHEFTENASLSLCKQYPNILDPSVELMIAASVQGVPLGNMSTITIDVQPSGARAQEKGYTINATVTPVRTRAPPTTAWHSWMLRDCLRFQIRQMLDAGKTFVSPAARLLTPSIYLVLGAENHTAQPPLITGRKNDQKCLLWGT